MYVLAKWMALFWTLAEGVILLALHWGYSRLRGKDTNQAIPRVLFAILLGVLLLWAAGVDEYVIRSAGVPEGPLTSLYRWGVWNFLCTLWVVLEGAIMIYVATVYRTLTGRARMQTEPDSRVSTFPFALIAALTVPFFLFFAIYQWGFLNSVLTYGMGSQQIYRVSVFYVRLCGLFWILFEWIVALYGIRTYSLLKKLEN